MRLPWPVREYARTCAKCGYTWRVPRSAARQRVRSISMISTASRINIDRGELAREISSISAQNKVAETFRQCPACGAEQFTQQPCR
jgi:ribosomal protein S27AE